MKGRAIRPNLRWKRYAGNTARPMPSGRLRPARRRKFRPVSYLRNEPGRPNACPAMCRVSPQGDSPGAAPRSRLGSASQILDVVEYGSHSRFHDLAPFFPGREGGVTVNAARRVASRLPLVRRERPLAARIILRGLLHVDRTRIDVEHHGGFDLVGVR